MKWILLGRLLILSSALLAQASAAAEKAVTSGSSLALTAGALHDAAAADVARMRRIIAEHGDLLKAAEESGLIVAVEAIREDLSANRELLAFAEERLRALALDLALGKTAENRDRVIPDPLVYPHVREIKILTDQSARLYQSGKRFLETLKRPTGTHIKRLGSSNTDAKAAEE